MLLTNKALTSKTFFLNTFSNNYHKEKNMKIFKIHLVTLA